MPWICNTGLKAISLGHPISEIPLSSDTWFKTLWRLLSRGLSTCKSPHPSVSQPETGKRRDWIFEKGFHIRKEEKRHGKALEEGGRAVWAVWQEKVGDMEYGAEGRWCVGVKHCSRKVEDRLVLKKVTEDPPFHWFCELLVLYSGWRMLVSQIYIPLSCHITSSVPTTRHVHRYLPIEASHTCPEHITHDSVSRHRGVGVCCNFAALNISFLWLLTHKDVSASCSLDVVSLC